jgi:alpha-N-arabinofuranosidase
MRRTILLITAVLICSAQNKPVKATIDASKTGHPISKYIYGQFLEHAGNLVNSGIWAEMIDDRKFYNPIKAKAPAEPEGPVWRRRLAPRYWTTAGPEEFVTLDAKRAWTGDHSPEIKLSKTEPHGVQQTGLAVRKGKVYSGRVILAATPGTSVKVNLVWGKGDGDEQTVVINNATAEYRKFPLKFLAQADEDDARIEIVATGSGSFHIGAVSLMPADNVEGFRAEVVAALKQLHSGVYRWPGGNFVSGHEWRNAVGEIDKRPPIYDPVWHAVQPNDVGTDEFMTLCRLLGVDAYITVNAGFGDAWSAAQLVEYVNGAATTPMGRWRAANGHPQPYNVKLWGVGNEPWGDWQLGHTSVEQFAAETRPVRQGHAQGGSDDQADRRRSHAGRHGGFQAGQAHQRPDRARLSLDGRLERLHAGALPGQHRHAQRALLLLQQPAPRPQDRREGLRPGLSRWWSGCARPPPRSA